MKATEPRTLAPPERRIAQVTTIERLGAYHLVHALDARPDKPELVVADCTTIVPTLSGSEFFGH